ncbi:ABC transporter ATP-binding protein [Tissierella praeacuta]|uniref:ABC transporter ATP-binding protein n=1 Tax=Tissierella praeacuta TaxID=43131 RepID=UPI003341FA52
MNAYKRLFKYVPEKMNYLRLSVVFSVITAVLTIVPYYYLWNFLREFFVAESLGKAMDYAVTIVALLIVYVVVYLVALWMSHLLGFRVETNLRKAGAEYLMNASWSFFDMNSSGRIRKIIDDNASRTHMVVAHLIPDTTVAILVPILMFITLIAIDYKLVILLLVISILGVLQFKGMYGDPEFIKHYTMALEKMNAESVEYVRGIQVLKVFNGTVYTLKSLYNSITDYAEFALNYSMSCRFPYVSFQTLFNLCITFTIPFVIFYINRGVNGMIILAEIVFFAAFVSILFASLMKVIYAGMYNMEAKDVVDKLEGMFNEMNKKKIEHGSIEEFNNFNIEFKNVSFKYEEDYVLENLSLKLEEGKTYALVGSSGSGKSTIAKLISGFYKIDGGEVLIGGENIMDYSEKAICKNITNVFQNARLFKMSIYENVKIGNQNASYDEVMRALKLANCNDILDKFETRENTIIGSEGVHLSGGEKQRIAIARAILKDANIIILDEASAAADPENEYEIQRAFSNLMEGKTVIMIAHRLSSIRNVDQILVLDDGKIVERGTDRELMSIDSRYRYLQELFSKANEWRVYDEMASR